MTENLNRKLKIAHIITRLINGGADENTVITCNQAIAAGHDVYLIYGKHTNNEILDKVDPRVQLIQISTLIREINLLKDFLSYLKIKNILRFLKPDVVHTHTSKAGILGRLAANSIGIHLIVHGVHIANFTNVGHLQRWLYLWAEKFVAPMTHAYINVSEGMKQLYLEAGLGTKLNHYIVPSGFDLQRFRNAEAPENWRSILRLEPDEPRPPILLMLAAFETRKRHLELLDTFNIITKKTPNIRLILAGDGKLRPQIENKIKEIGLQKNIILAGFWHEPEKLIALADICILTSVREGLPRVIMQYLAGGKPCVTSSLPGLNQVLKDGINGIEVKNGPQNITDLIYSIDKILRDENLYMKLRKGALETDLNGWDEIHMGRTLENIYYNKLSSIYS